MKQSIIIVLNFGEIGLISSNRPVKKKIESKIKYINNLLISELLSLKLKSNNNKILIKKQIPPINGVGFLCILRLFGISLIFN